MQGMVLPTVSNSIERWAAMVKPTPAQTVVLPARWKTFPQSRCCAIIHLLAARLPNCAGHFRRVALTAVAVRQIRRCRTAVINAVFDRAFLYRAAAGLQSSRIPIRAAVKQCWVGDQRSSRPDGSGNTFISSACLPSSEV